MGIDLEIMNQSIQSHLKDTYLHKFQYIFVLSKEEKQREACFFQFPACLFTHLLHTLRKILLQKLYNKTPWVTSSHSAEHLAAFESPQLSISSADCFLCRKILSTPSLQNKLPVAMKGNHSSASEAWKDGDSSSRHCLPQAEQPTKLQPFLRSGRYLLGNFAVQQKPMSQIMKLLGETILGVIISCPFSLSCLVNHPGSSASM